MCRDAAEVRAQVDARAPCVDEQVADLLVDADVGAAEAVDALLRIADDEEGAGTEGERSPVRRWAWVLGVGPRSGSRLAAHGSRTPSSSRCTCREPKAESPEPLCSSPSRPARSTRISACSGSVSWNSSTRMYLKRVWNRRRTGAQSRTRSRARRSRSRKSSAPARVLIVVEIDALQEFLLQQRGEVGVGVPGERL